MICLRATCISLREFCHIQCLEHLSNSRTPINRFPDPGYFALSCCYCRCSRHLIVALLSSKFWWTVPGSNRGLKLAKLLCSHLYQQPVINAMSFCEDSNRSLRGLLTCIQRHCLPHRKATVCILVGAVGVEPTVPRGGRFTVSWGYQFSYTPKFFCGFLHPEPPPKCGLCYTDRICSW